ncbi:MAG TPA: TIGR01777 family oxidoreductase [Acidimicrobiales bacterium]|jgi:hypothetical protein
MKVLITGSHGMIGSALAAALEADGHDVVRLSRGGGTSSWDPERGLLDERALIGIDAAVHLAGAGIADKRWTPERKEEIRRSRTVSTDLLARRLAAMDPRPDVLVSGSAIGFYGSRGDELLDEDSPPGSGYLADVVRQWETATGPAEEAGIRVVHIRTGVVQSRQGGALRKQLPLFRFGLGGRLASGAQYVSWITLDDEIAAIRHALDTASLAGAVNLTAPNPVTNAEYTRVLGKALGRPTVLTVPNFALGLALGSDMTEEMLTASARVLPNRLQNSGFQFQHPTLAEALASVLR